MLVTLATSVIAGVLATVLPPLGTLAAAALGAAALLVVLLRRALGELQSGPPHEHHHEATDTSREASAAPDPPELRLARGLFYLGALFVGEAAFRPAAGLTISEIFFILSLGTCTFAVLRGHAIAPVPTPLLISACVFAFGGAISSVHAHSSTASVVGVLHGLYVMVLWFWAAAMVLRTRRQVMAAVMLWGVSIAADGFGAVAQLLGIHALVGSAEGNRMTGFTQHPNDLGGAAAVALVPALMMASRSLTTGHLGRRTLRWIPLALIALALVLSGSVAALLAAAVAMAVWLISPSVPRSAHVAIGLAVAAAILALAFAGSRIESPVQRLRDVLGTSTTQSGSSSGQVRVSVLAAVWPRIVANPIVGDGLDIQGTGVTIIDNGVSTFYPVHNATVAAWYEAGLLGLLGALGSIAVLAAIGWRSIVWSADREDLLVGLALLSALAAFVVYANTAPLDFQQYGWFALVLIVAWRLNSGMPEAFVSSTRAPPAVPFPSREIALSSRR